MDESEAICLAFESNIMTKTIARIFQKYHDGNCIRSNCEFYKNFNLENTQFSNCCKNWGELWFLVDINQASLFLPKHSPNILKTPSISLNKVMRSTVCIFDILKDLYANPIPLMPKHLLENMKIPKIKIGHDFLGPPVYWINFEIHKNVIRTTVKIVIDLCASKGFKPNDICVIPFLFNDCFTPNHINEILGEYFVENGYKPKGMVDVEKFIENKEVNDFLIAWALRVKGLEFKVVIMVFDEEDFDEKDFEDRKKTYIITSRATCMLILVSSENVKNAIDTGKVMETYPFSISL